MVTLKFEKAQLYHPNATGGTLVPGLQLIGPNGDAVFFYSFEDFAAFMDTEAGKNLLNLGV